MSGSKRNARGSGSIGKRKDGRWSGRYVVKLPNGQRKVKAVYGKTQGEVREKLAQCIARRDKGEIMDSNGLTVEKFYNIWISEIVDNYLKPTTIELYRRVFKNYVLPILGKKRLESLCVDDVQKCINLTKKRSVYQAHLVQKGLSSMLNKAKKRYIISNNSARDVEMPKIEPKEPDMWNIQQLNNFLYIAKQFSPYYVAYLILATYGVRRGEVLGIRWKDVDFENNCIHIRQQVTSINNRPQITTLKTKSSIRDLPLNSQILRALGSISNEEMSGLVFQTKNGTPISPRNFYRDFCKITRKASLPHIKLHSLRHMAACLMRDKGVDPKTCQSILGHSTLNTTLSIYQHSNMANKEDAVLKMESLISA